MNNILFPTLPLELRELIYRFAVLPDLPEGSFNQISVQCPRCPFNEDPHRPYFFPEFCYVNEATRNEVGLWFIRNAEFEIQDLQQLVSFRHVLQTFPHGQGFAAIRRLKFETFGHNGVAVTPGESGQSVFNNFMRCCPGVTEIRIKFGLFDVSKSRFRASVHGLLAMEELRSQTILIDLATTIRLYYLEGFLDLENLTKVVIEMWPKDDLYGSRSQSGMAPEYFELMRGLAGWIRMAFSEKSRKVIVELVESRSGELAIWASGNWTWDLFYLS